MPNVAALTKTIEDKRIEIEKAQRELYTMTEALKVVCPHEQWIYIGTLPIKEGGTIVEIEVHRCVVCWTEKEEKRPC